MPWAFSQNSDSKAVKQVKKNKRDSELISEAKKRIEKYNRNFSIGLDEFKLSDQNGCSLDISPSDTRILTSAIILHEKAKNLMKSKEYLKALILLAEADNEFKYIT